MDLAEYKECLDKVSHGKRLPNALYVYRGKDIDLGAKLNSLIGTVQVAHKISDEFNILKFRCDELKLSFLSYPDFFKHAHPSLRHAITIDLATGKTRHTDYSRHSNPPILHRKECFLPTGHPLWAEFAALSAAEDIAGLYEETSAIGFKVNWERLLMAKRIEIVGHELRWIEGSDPQDCRHHKPRIAVERHKTAIARYDLSKPIKSLLEYGLLSPKTTIFDYGCGHAADVTGLRSLGYGAEGWDPVHRPDIPKRDADVVNLGYVLNVIEDPAERVEALLDAYRYAKRLLIVSALIQQTVNVQLADRLRDGVVTKWNTFQKYFEQQELQQYIEDALEVTAIPVALGVFYVFRDPVEQQDFLSARTRRTIDWSQISARLGLGGPPRARWEVLYEQNRELLDSFGKTAIGLGRFPQPGEFDRESELIQKVGSAKRGLRAYVLGGGAKGLIWSEVAVRFGIGQPQKPRWEIVFEQHRELLDVFWQRTLQLGRAPAPEEFPRWTELCGAIGSAKKALRLFKMRGGKEDLERATESRRKDLLVYVALANLRKRVPFGHLSQSLRLDIRAFFRDYQRALAKGLELLYAAGDAGEIELACENLQIGRQDEQALYVHRSLLDQLPPVLRVYVGCASVLYGDVNQADIIKLHKASGKITFLVYDDFDGKNLPVLQQRIKVNLRTRFVQVFDHSAEGQLLCFKERYVGFDYPAIERLIVFSAKLKKLGLSENVGFGHTRAELQALANKHGLTENLNRRRAPSRKESSECSSRPSMR